MSQPATSESQGHSSSQPRPGHGHSNRGNRPRSSRTNQEQSARPASANEPGQAASPQGAMPENSRGRRGRRGGAPRNRQGRRGAATQTSTMAPQRTFGGHLTAPSASGSTQSGDAPAFVPGQPLLQRRYFRSPSHPFVICSTDTASPNSAPSRAKEARQPRRSKSSAPDLPTRIHEDIDNGQYECVICTGEVVRTSQVWSCSICWTVAHLHCVKKWHNNQTRDS